MPNTSGLTLALAAAAFVILGGCEVRQTQQAKAPKVEVIEPGQPPKYEVKGPDVTVTTEKRNVNVPHVTVTPPSDKK